MAASSAAPAFSGWYLVSIHCLLLGFASLPLLLSIPNYVQIVVVSGFCVYVGCVRSVKAKVPQEQLSHGDALRFPVLGSCMLLGLFLAIKYMPREYLDMVVDAYCWLLGVAAYGSVMAPLLAALVGEAPMSRLVVDRRGKKTPLLEDDFTLSVGELLGGFLGVGVATWYYVNKFWLSNNLLGLAFTLTGIEVLGVGGVSVGVALMGVLFVYDIFWVFYTPVMITVAKGINAPLKLLFTDAAYLLAPPDAEPTQNALGLGDMVLPGLLLSIILRMDMLKNGGKTHFFVSTMTGYVLAVCTCMFCMMYFKAAQPALLYIVPGMLGALSLHAAIAGKLREVFTYSEASDEEIKQQRAGAKKDGGASTPEASTAAPSAADKKAT